MPVRKREKKCEEGAPPWLLTWGDLCTLLLTFFVVMYNVGTIDEIDLNIMLSAFQGLGPREGGNTLETGKLAELGNTVMNLPTMERGQSLARAKKTALSVFQPEVKARKVRIKEDERGLIISLASDAYFRPASADVNIEESRTLLQNLALLLSSGDLAGRTFRIEGHTDDRPTDADGPFPTNWELSTARSTNVLHYLVDFGADERRFQVAGFSDTVPLASNDTEEGRAYNRRVDVVILNEGHL
ncbi:MAG: flagellar motor protein MotB [Spirochaetes bacterium RBG_13_68_11]|nr:MAG: flagellar motor protein MotB [Spirochaetes bacterium RBG_13_68_11]